MKFQTIKLRFILFFICFIYLFSNEILFANQRNEIEKVINSIKNEGFRARSKLCQTTLRLFDYSHFFASSIPHIWDEANHSEKNQIIRFYNSYFIDKYFSDILSCEGMEVDLIDQGASIVCKYLCANSRDIRPNVIRFIKSSSKISDIQFRGISFLRNEGDSIRNRYGRYNKEQFLDNLN